MERNAQNIHNDELIEMFNLIIEKKDTYTAGHSKRVAFYATKIAECLSLDEAMMDDIYQASLLHDIGKLIIPEAILLKPKKLTKKEYKIIQNHVADGIAILEKMTPCKPLIPYIKSHHERYDGRGYPEQLSGESIPLISRIICVADAFDAMTTERIYKPQKSLIEAIEELKICKNAQFDPIVVDAAVSFFETYEDLEKIHQMPTSILEEERFAFYFKDKITTAYSSEYLNYFLSNNSQYCHVCCYLIEVHSVMRYNKEFGWKVGNKMLKEMVSRLRALFNNAFVFRIFGDDFIVINREHINVDIEEVKERLATGYDFIKVSVTHFNLQDYSFKTWEDFEPYVKTYLQREKGVIKL